MQKQTQSSATTEPTTAPEVSNPGQKGNQDLPETDAQVEAEIEEFLEELAGAEGSPATAVFEDDDDGDDDLGN